MIENKETIQLSRLDDELIIKNFDTKKKRTRNETANTLNDRIKDMTDHNFFIITKNKKKQKRIASTIEFRAEFFFRVEKKSRVDKKRDRQKTSVTA